MNVLGATAHQFSPGCEDNTLVLQGFFDCRVEHGEHIAPAERAAVADVGEVGAGVGTMHDHHGDARLELVEGVDIEGCAPMLQLAVVVGYAIGNFPVVAEVVQVVEHGETGVPEDGAEIPDLCYPGIGESGLLLDQLVGAPRQHDGDMVADANLHVSFQKFGSGVDGAHVGVDMGRLEAHGAGAVELGGDLGGYFVGGGVPGDLGDGRPEVSGAVGEAGDDAAAGYRAPAIIIPFGGKGEVKAGV